MYVDHVQTSLPWDMFFLVEVYHSFTEILTGVYNVNKYYMNIQFECDFYQFHTFIAKLITYH